MTPAPRQAGLDTLRALAITLVFAYHYRVFVSATPDLGWVSELGWAGVDLFFVLSGYLIGNQVFAGLARGEAFSAPRFYLRRALRTLPAFWVVLALFFAFPGELGGRTPPPLWRFLTFTQNIGLQPGTAFSHAWSLCVEEQFYLVLPLVVLAGVACVGGRRAGWCLLAALLAVGVGARIVLWQRFGLERDGHTEGHQVWIYYNTLCRFDEFLPGLALAMLKNFHPRLWGRFVLPHGGRWLAGGVLAVGAVGVLAARTLYIDGYGYGFAMTAFGYSLLALAFALLVAAALSPSSWLARHAVPGAGPLARASDRKSTRLNSSHTDISRMPSSA